MSSEVAEKFLVLVEQGIAQSADDPLPVLLDDPEDPEGFQPLLFLYRTLSHDQWNDLYLTFSVYHQSPRPDRSSV